MDEKPFKQHVRTTNIIILIEWMNISSEEEKDSCDSFLRKVHNFFLGSQNPAALSFSRESCSSRLYETDHWAKAY